MNTMQTTAVIRPESFDHVKIAIREKPLTEVEKANVQVMLRTDSNKLIAFYPDSKEGLMYNYDFFFPEEATQLDVHQTIGVEMVDIAMSGFSTTCIAYGPSNAGKTHTLFGSDQEPGLIQLATKELFHRMENSSQMQYSISFSYWEMNCDTIFDVLASGDAVNLPVRRSTDDGRGAAYVPGMTLVDIGSWDELDEFLAQGNIRRIQNSAERTARWHGVVKLFIQSSQRTQNPESITTCTMTFVHLKGSDRVGQKRLNNEVTKDAMLHGSNINKSLTLLGSAVLHAVEHRRGGDPTHLESSQSFFSESKFTQILSSALCGSEATFIVGTVSTLDYHETTDTLENLQNLQQLTCFLRRATKLTDYGRLRKKVDKEADKVPKSTLCEGHPLSEIEERVRAMQLQLQGKVPEDPQIKLPPIQPRVIPEDIQVWKQSVLKAKLHGDRATVYIPSGKRNNTYKGQWTNGKKEGFGTLLTKLTKYEGGWANGMRDGEGTYWTRATEQSEWVRQYKGCWREDLKHGYGICWHTNGDVYEGYFADGMRSAMGKLFKANGDRIEGQFKSDMVHGWATLYCSNGDRFEGQWVMNMREGLGNFFYVKRQQIYRGEWHKDVAKFGVIEDMPSKETNATSSFLPQLRLENPNRVLEKQKAELDDKRSRYWSDLAGWEEEEGQDGQEQLSW